MWRLAALVGYVACVPIANFLIGHVGTECIPRGPCVVPVGLGLSAPSGVLMIGLALVLRDLVQMSMGARVAAGAVVVGAAFSVAVSPASIAVASGAAFMSSEIIDMAVFTALRRRQWLAVLASSVVGLVVDSALFLWLAFGSLHFVAGQIVGKTWMVLLATPAVLILRRRRKAGQ